MARPPGEGLRTFGNAIGDVAVHLYSASSESKGGNDLLYTFSIAFWLMTGPMVVSGWNPSPTFAELET